MKGPVSTASKNAKLSIHHHYREWKVITRMTPFFFFNHHRIYHFPQIRDGQESIFHSQEAPAFLLVFSITSSLWLQVVGRAQQAERLQVARVLLSQGPPAGLPPYRAMWYCTSAALPLEIKNIIFGFLRLFLKAAFPPRLESFKRCFITEALRQPFGRDSSGAEMQNFIRP